MYVLNSSKKPVSFLIKHKSFKFLYNRYDGHCYISAKDVLFSAARIPQQTCCYIATLHCLSRNISQTFRLSLVTLYYCCCYNCCKKNEQRQQAIFKWAAMEGQTQPQHLCGSLPWLSLYLLFAVKSWKKQSMSLATKLLGSMPWGHCDTLAAWQLWREKIRESKTDVNFLKTTKAPVSQIAKWEFYCLSCTPTDLWKKMISCPTATMASC